MMRFSFTIGNPWARSGDGDTHHYYLSDMIIADNKSLEIQVSRWSQASELFEFALDLRWRGHDHAGPRIELTVWRYFACVQIYDHRHWNYREGRWFMPGEDPFD